jgi:ribose/xylose/arabinose/galactoside ABC-type transport system permease subunit
MNYNTVFAFLKRHMMELILLALIITLSFANDRFLTLPNIFVMLRANSHFGVIAFGLTMVIITGEIDLSVGSTVALSGIIIARMSEWLYAVPNEAGRMIFPEHIPAFGAILGILAICAYSCAVGTIIAWIRFKFRLPTFIISLTFLYITYGIAFAVSGGMPVRGYPTWYRFIGTGTPLGVPMPVWILLFVFAATFVTMHYTKFGRSVYAVGGNPEAARLSGINVLKVRISVHVIAQLMAALAGILISAGLGSATHPLGRGWELNAISAVVLGGAAMTGGIGRVRGTLVGIIFLAVVVNGLTLLNVSDDVQYIVKGMLILGAVLFNAMQSRKA